MSADEPVAADNVTALIGAADRNDAARDHPPASFPRRRESSVSSLERRWVPAFAGTTTGEMCVSTVSASRSS
jgi:hypothetical protein